MNIIDLKNFGKFTKRGWQFSQKDKDTAWDHLCNQRSTVTARHADRDNLERLAEVTAEIATLTAEREKLLNDCEDSIKTVGRQFGKTGNKWVAFIQKQGKAVPFVLSITRAYRRADFKSWCEANGITAERVMADGFITDVKESKAIGLAGKTHIADITREYCLELVGGNNE